LRYISKAEAERRTAAHWIATQLLPTLRERNHSFTDTPVTPPRFAEMLAMLAKNEINANAAKEVMGHLFEDDDTPAEIVDKYGFRQVSDAGQLEKIVDEILASNVDAVKDYRNGVEKAMGYLIGRAMQASKGKGNPKMIKEMLAKKLDV
jgi:aspartyl-tRNA(Asn)/glutamyl-tRNA(Gln) amidotransferase subunit B